MNHVSQPPKPKTPADCAGADLRGTLTPTTVPLSLVKGRAPKPVARFCRIPAAPPADQPDASRAGWDSFPDDPDFVVLADPEGNRFCLADLDHGSA